ncbi:hypothetical protein [Desulfocastanea catecholica]
MMHHFAIDLRAEYGVKDLAAEENGVNPAWRELNKIKNSLQNKHPHLKVIVVEDGLSSNCPHIRDLQEHNLRFILGVKPGDQVALFAELREAVAAGKASEVVVLDPKDRKKGISFDLSTRFP